jgi:hypothetical protein
MEMKKVFMISFMAAVVLMASSCLRVKLGENGWSLINKSGPRNDTPTQVHELDKAIAMQPFDRLHVSGPFNIILEQGQAGTVRVDGTIDQLGATTIYVKDGELFVDMKEDMVDSGRFFKGMRVFVCAVDINGIEIAGSGSVTAPAALAVNDLGLNVAGSGDITLAQLTCHDLDIEIAGSGSVTLGPVQADGVKTDIAGSGDIEVARLSCKNLYNQVAGSGDMTFNNANVEEVKSDIAGSGNVIVRGKVGSHNESVAGSGKVSIIAQ